MKQGTGDVKGCVTIPEWLVMAVALSLGLTSLQAHEWHRERLPEAGSQREALREHLQASPKLPVPPSPSVMMAANGGNASVLRFILSSAILADATAGPEQSAAFQKFSRVKLRWDADFLYIESDGMPDHNMMVGITAWQQQVPLPQPYSGDNAWRIPLHPVAAKEPLSIEGRFLRGAIALAANGIPIFNPQNNRGEISAEIGELDQWGGHCGRADDYHYHAAPLHLQSVTGTSLPIAYALDGYPIYGLTEVDGTMAGQLDAFNGHELPGVGYHYHASLKYPYVNGGFHGVVVEREKQVDPQPHAQPVRPDTSPLRDAEITGFKSTDANHYQLSYKVAGEAREVRYSVRGGGVYAFEFDNGREGMVRQTYTRKGGGQGNARSAALGVMFPGGKAPPVMSEESGIKTEPAMDPGMKVLWLLIMGVHAIALLTVISPGSIEQGKKGGGQREGDGGEEFSQAVVPPYLFNIMLGRPGADMMTASVLSGEPMEGFIEYGRKADVLNSRTSTFNMTAGEPVSMLLDGLKPDFRYFYRFNYRCSGSTEFHCDEVRSFHTQRTPESDFTFTTQASSHLDANTDVNGNLQRLANMLGDKPDFMIDFGAPTMVDSFGNFFTRTESQYRAQRYYLGQLAHSVPVLQALGNHDGEVASRLNGQPYSMPLWSLCKRKKYFPNPEPGGIYAGNETPFENAGLLQNYFAWEWGSALFLVLDPFWASPGKKCEENWSMTLGETQYRWLTKTLEASKAPFKFVFIHHLVGGLGREVRGSMTPAPFMEWGGKNSDGTDGFRQHRPDWALPIHQLLVKHGVSIVFHGQDHLYVKEELDGIIYQEVPRSAYSGSNTRYAKENGSTGTILGSPGHLRVHVSPNETQVDYIRTAVAGLHKSDGKNGTVAHTYVITSRQIYRDSNSTLPPPQAMGALLK